MLKGGLQSRFYMLLLYWILSPRYVPLCLRHVIICQVQFVCVSGECLYAYLYIYPCGVLLDHYTALQFVTEGCLRVNNYF